MCRATNPRRKIHTGRGEQPEACAEKLRVVFPLWKFNNVVITPHIAGRSDKDRAGMVGTIKENIERFVAGKPLINVVDKRKGY